MSRLLRATHLGRLAAFGSAASYAMVATTASLAYELGTSPGAVVVARLIVGLAAALAAIVMLRRSWSLPRREWWPTGAIAVAWMVVTIGYMASFYYIPVSLAVLIFFTFPVQIAVVGPLVAGRIPDALTLVAALAAFAGLALALGPDLGGLDWRGCLLALAAAVGAMATFLLSRRLVSEQDMFTFSFNLHALCVAAIVLYALAAGGVALPARGAPIAALGAVGVFYAAAMLLQFAGIRLAGPARASIVFNAEPIITMLGAALVLGERLGPWQATGAALVIGAVLFSTRIDRVRAE